MEPPGRVHQDPVKQDRLAYSALAVTTLLYVALRASLVPWVHDECASIHWYMERGQWLPYRALWDAGNHFASSAIGALGHTIWGLSLPGSRAGSVLAFVPFAWAVYRLGLFITDRRIRWPFWLALLPCPFLLDFFALFRGYGPAMAFVCLGLVAAVHYIQHRRLRHLVLLPSRSPPFAGMWWGAHTRAWWPWWWRCSLAQRPLHCTPGNGPHPFPCWCCCCGPMWACGWAWHW